MKVYLYNPETGLYEGETFEETAMLKNESGLTTAPPPDYDHGQVPVFDQQKSAWVVIPVTIARQLLKLRSTSTMEKSA